MNELLRDRKEAESAAGYWAAIAFSAIRSVWLIAPDLLSQVRGTAFAAGVQALCSAYSESAAEALAVVKQLSPEAAEMICNDLPNGPAALIALWRDSARLKALVALPPIPQAIELGKLITEVASQNARVGARVTVTTSAPIAPAGA